MRASIDEERLQAPLLDLRIYRVQWVGDADAHGASEHAGNEGIGHHLWWRGAWMCEDRPQVHSEGGTAVCSACARTVASPEGDG